MMKKVYLKTSPNIKSKVETIFSSQFKEYIVVDSIDSIFFYVIEVTTTEDLTLLKKMHINSGNQLLVISHLADEENVIHLMNELEVHNLIGMNTPSFESEFTYFLEGLEQRKIDLLSDKTTEIYKSKEIDSIVSKTINRYEWDEFFDSPVQFLTSIANELITNAIYNAPHTDDGKAIYRDGPRNEEVNLQIGEHVHFDIVKDSNAVTIIVKDHFGRIDFNKIRSKLLRSVEEKRPVHGQQGAGLGLYLVYQYSNFVSFRVCPGVSTEIVCKIEKNKRYKQYRERITSFFYIEGVCDE